MVQNSAKPVTKPQIDGNPGKLEEKSAAQETRW